MAGNNMSVSMILEMEDRFSRKTGQVNRSFSRMSQNGQRAMAGIQRSAGLAYKGLDRMGNRYMALATGAGGAAAVRSVVQLEQRLTRLGVQARRSKEEIRALYDEVITTAQKNNVRIEPSQILDAMDKIIEKTGDYELALNNIENIGLTISATGSQGTDVGAMIADLSGKFDIKKPEALFETLDILTEQGKDAAFTLQNMAVLGERVTSTYGVTGRTGKMAAREMGALLQLSKDATGPAEVAATALEAMMRAFTDVNKLKMITRFGVRITDPKDPKRMRAMTDILKELVVAADGSEVKLQPIFGAEGIRAVRALISEYNKTDGFARLDKLMNSGGSGTALLEDATRMADTSAAKLQTVMTALKDDLFRKLEKPVGLFSDVAANNSGMVGAGVTGLSLLGLGIFGAKGYKLIKSLSGGAGQKALRAAGGVAEAGSGSLGSYMAGYTGYKGVSKVSKLGRFGKAIPYLGAGLAAYDIGSAAISGDKGDMGEALGSAGGTLSGMALGAAVGSVVPVVGTAIGAAVGGVLGSFGGGSLGRYIATSSDANPEGQLSGKIEIKVDATGRTQVTAGMNNPNIETVIDQGILMGPAL